MILQVAKIVNSARFPVKYCYLPRYLILIGPILLSILTIDCRMTEKTEKSLTTPQENSKLDDAIVIHRRAIAIDMHADTAQRLVDEKVNLQERLPNGHFDSVRAREGGLDAQFFSIWVEPQLFGGGGQSADRKSTRLNSSHGYISYAVFCLKKKDQ